MQDRSAKDIASDIAQYMLKTDNYGLSDKTLAEQRTLAIACVVIIAMALGVCSLEGIETVAGRIAFASSGWLTLALLFLCLYLATNYFFAYWRDRNSFSYRMHLALSEHRIHQLLGYAHDASVPEDEKKKAVRDALDDAARRKYKANAYYLVMYLLMPICFVAGALITLVTQAPWTFGHNA